MEDLDALLFVVPHDHGPEMLDCSGWVNGFRGLVGVREADWLLFDCPIFPAKYRGRQDANLVLAGLDLHVVAGSDGRFVIFR